VGKGDVVAPQLEQMEKLPAPDKPLFFLYPIQVYLTTVTTGALLAKDMTVRTSLTYNPFHLRPLSGGHHGVLSTKPTFHGLLLLNLMPWFYQTASL
jgi:hypothetical protein